MKSKIIQTPQDSILEMSSKDSKSKEKTQFYITRKTKIPYSNSRSNKENVPSQDNLLKPSNKQVLKEITNNIPSNLLFNPVCLKYYLRGDEDQELDQPQLASNSFTQHNYQRRQSIQPLQDQQIVISHLHQSSINFLPPIQRKNYSEHHLVIRKYKKEHERSDCQKPLGRITPFNAGSNLSEQDYERLVEWIFDASTACHQTMSNETVFLAVSIFDRFSSKAQTKVDLQLIGGISLLLSSKMIDIYSLEMTDLTVNILHELFTIHQILILEQKITAFLDHNLIISTTFDEFDDVFQKIYSEFKEILFVELNKIFEVGISLLKLLLKKQPSIRQYSTIEQSMASLTYSIMLVMDDKTPHNTQLKLICLQRTLDHTVHYKLNINRIEQLMVQINSWFDAESFKFLNKIMKY